MKLDELKSMADEDLKLDDTELAKESLNIPQLHNKYLQILQLEYMKLKRLENNVSSLYRELHEYYAGNADPDVYRKRGMFNLKVLKGDLPTYIESNEDYQRAKERREMQKSKVDYLNGILKIISNRQWHIRNAIEWHKFTQGIS